MQIIDRYKIQRKKSLVVRRKSEIYNLIMSERATEMELTDVPWHLGETVKGMGQGIRYIETMSRVIRKGVTSHNRVRS